MTVTDVLAYIRTQKLAVVATNDSDGHPQAAVVEFGELDDLTIIIDTFTYSRKYKNIQANDRVALVIGWDDDITVQINAQAELLEGRALEAAKQAYFAKNKRAQKWEDRPDVAYLAFKPIWLRYSDVGQTPWLIEEFIL